MVLPDRVTPSLVKLLRGSRLTPWVVIHANHPAEIDDHVVGQWAQLVDAGIPLLNQTVLLRGVNDSAPVLAELFLRLCNARVAPYYLHQLDPVRGARHFEVPEERGREIMEELRTRLPGYALPRFVREEPGAQSKLPV